MSEILGLILSALTMGLLGSGHCLGMCGPLMFSLSLQGGAVKRFLIAFYYNIMRILSYAIIGFIMGLVGGGLNSGIHGMENKEAGLIEVQSYLSIFSGTALIIWALGYQRFFLGKLGDRIENLISRVSAFSFNHFRKDHPIHLGILGLLHGWLPCGLVYIAATTSLSYGQADLSMAFMIFFGLGTFPSMILSLLGFAKLSNKMRLRFQTAISISLFLMGCFFILRGLNLGIPFLSPSLDKLGNMLFH